jgi:hypothetical protein
MEMVAEETVARIVAQPTNEDEEQACMEAAEYCPLGALSITTPESSNESPCAVALGSAPTS